MKCIVQRSLKLRPFNFKTSLYFKIFYCKYPSILRQNFNLKLYVSGRICGLQNIGTTVHVYRNEMEKNSTENLEKKKQEI